MVMKSYRQVIRSKAYRECSQLAQKAYMRIMAAAEANKGVHLTADDVFAISMDDAVSTAADNLLSVLDDTYDA
jgi:hypothetical protein